MGGIWRRRIPVCFVALGVRVVWDSTEAGLRIPAWIAAGDRKKVDDWFEREMWIAKNGALSCNGSASLSGSHLYIFWVGRATAST